MIRKSDTSKWQNLWYITRSAHAKLILFYMRDNCDRIGIWNFQNQRTTAERLMGIKPDWSAVFAELNDFTGYLDETKRVIPTILRLPKIQEVWWLPHFIPTQHFPSGWTPGRPGLNWRKPKHRNLIYYLAQRNMLTMFVDLFPGSIAEDNPELALERRRGIQDHTSNISEKASG